VVIGAESALAALMRRTASYAALGAISPASNCSLTGSASSSSAASTARATTHVATLRHTVSYAAAPCESSQTSGYRLSRSAASIGCILPAWLLTSRHEAVFPADDGECG
jgi:hypothetical protein